MNESNTEYLLFHSVERGHLKALQVMNSLCISLYASIIIVIIIIYVILYSFASVQFPFWNKRVRESERERERERERVGLVVHLLRRRLRNSTCQNGVGATILGRNPVTWRQKFAHEDLLL